MSPARVLAVFLALGCRCFGGPVAHVAYFRAEFVARRAWLSERAFADLVALCQFIPGPTSSQIGMLLGWRQAGWAGLLAAWVGFTLPSALLMVAAGIGVAALDPAAAAPWIHGMKVAVLAIVGGAVAAMWRSLCGDRWRASLALATAAGVLLAPLAWLQLPLLALAGLLGRWLPDSAAGEAPAEPGPVPSPRTAIACLLLLAGGLLLLPLLAAPAAVTCSGLFRTGSLVVGGGHVALPLLTADLVEGGRMPADTLLLGYGLAQVVPGPMFSVAGFVGAVLHGPWLGLLAVVAIFAPGGFIALAALPVWERLMRHAAMRRIADGLGAGVVGLLIAALYDPLATSALHGPGDAALACLALAALLLRCPPWLLVPACAGISALAC